jgi:hypothetical protein
MLSIGNELQPVSNGFYATSGRKYRTSGRKWRTSDRKCNLACRILIACTVYPEYIRVFSSEVHYGIFAEKS